MDAPPLKRKRRLEKLITPAPESTLYLAHFEKGQETLRSAGFSLQLEALVPERVESGYQPAIRSLDWVKLKRTGGIPAQRFGRGSAEALSR